MVKTRAQTLPTISSVIITGAGGKTGKAVFAKCVQDAELERVVGVVRTEKSKKMVASFAPDAKDEDVVVASIVDGTSVKDVINEGKFDALICCTSATPRIMKRSIVKLLVTKVLNFIPGVNMKPAMPTFRWPENGTPEEVDWEGQKAQFDAAVESGVKLVVVCSSMGGTQDDNRLNAIGEGNILKWKRAAERYLIELCKGTNGKTNFTIVHPGGLKGNCKDLEAEGGKVQLTVGVDDTLLENEYRSIPRADVAEVLFQSLKTSEALNRSFDVASLPEGEGVPFDGDLGTLLSDGLPKQSVKGGTCDYTLGEVFPPSTSGVEEEEEAEAEAKTA